MSPSTSILAAILLFVATSSEGKTFTRCELAKMLLNVYKFDKRSLGDWVCLAEAESSLNSRAVSKGNDDGSKDYGLFQINSMYWCYGGAKSQYNECKVACAALTDDNITDDVNCAKFIYKRHKFNAWTGWVKKCQGQNVQSYIANCNL